MQKSIKLVNYNLKRHSTNLSTGFFDGIPEKVDQLSDKIAYIKENPMDDFMRRSALRSMFFNDAEKLDELLNGENDVIAALALEFVILNRQNPDFEGIEIKKSKIKMLKNYSSLIYLRAAVKQTGNFLREFGKACKDNVDRHISLADLNIKKFKTLYHKKIQKPDVIDISFYSKELKEKYEPVFFPLSGTIKKAEDILKKCDVFSGIEMRNEASLSPVALQRNWKLDLTVSDNNLHYSLKGEMTSYGKGISIDKARASLLMEIVERYASFASFSDDKILNKKIDSQIIKSSYSELKKAKYNVLDPNLLKLEIPYENEPIHWMNATISGEKSETVLVPVQAVFLFCNLDEQSLFSSLGSTGLASGNTMEEAKVSALLEAIERDHEATVPYDPSMCFELISTDEYIGSLLESYKVRGIKLQFQDLTNHLGIPCCKAFVKGIDGSIAKGTSANLDARKAIISAITEVPWPYPSSPESSEGLKDLTIVGYENLPDYSTGNAEGDLKLIEIILAKAGYTPVYVDLTRDDVDLPVVKAIIPGFEWSADFDDYSIISPRFMDKAFS